MTLDNFSPKQQHQLNDLYCYCDPVINLVESLCSLTSTDFIVQYYPKSGTFVCSLYADDYQLHRIGVLTAEQYTPEDDLDPYSILFHPIILTQAIGNGTMNLQMAGMDGLTRYEMCKRVYGKGYSLQNYLAADPLDQYHLNYYFRYNHEARTFYYSIDRTSTLQAPIDFYNFYIGNDKTDMVLVIDDTMVDTLLDTQINEAELLIGSVFQNYLEDNKDESSQAEVHIINCEMRKLRIDIILADLA